MQYNEFLALETGNWPVSQQQAWFIVLYTAFLQCQVCWGGGGGGGGLLNLSV